MSSVKSAQVQEGRVTCMGRRPQTCPRVSTLASTAAPDTSLCVARASKKKMSSTYFCALQSGLARQWRDQRRVFACLCVSLCLSVRVSWSVCRLLGSV